MNKYEKKLRERATEFAKGYTGLYWDNAHKEYKEYKIKDMLNLAKISLNKEAEVYRVAYNKGWQDANHVHVQPLNSILMNMGHIPPKKTEQ